MAVSSRNLIIVTGTPGVGKTAISRLLAKATHGTHIDCGKLALRRKLAKGYDRQDQSYVIDETRLARELCEIVRTSRSHVVLEGHIVSRVVGLNPSIVFVLRCHPELLIRRLRRKKYRAKKIAENIAAEILDVCLKEAVESYGSDKTVELDVTHKSQRQVASMMLRILNGKAKLKRGHIDWIRRLERERGLLNVLTYITSSADTIVG